MTTCGQCPFCNEIEQLSHVHETVKCDENMVNTNVFARCSVLSNSTPKGRTRVRKSTLLDFFYDTFWALWRLFDTTVTQSCRRKPVA